MFKINQVIGLVFFALLVYSVLLHLGLLPGWAPHLFNLPKGPPAA